MAALSQSRLCQVGRVVCRRSPGGRAFAGSETGGLAGPFDAEKDDAVESQAKVLLRQDPGNYYGNLRVAVALRLAKKYADADAIVQPMLAAYPTDVTWLDEQGLLELAQGKKELAKETFADVLALDPQNPTATQALQGL